jgi:hypothetical protein
MQAANRRMYLQLKTGATLALWSLALPAVLTAAPHAAWAQAEAPITVLLNGAPIDFGGAAPIQIDGRVLVPLRGVFEALGATVDYDAATQKVFAVRGETQMQLTLGSVDADVNGQPRKLDVPAQARLGRTLVPLRFVSEALGANVSWNDAARAVTIVATPPATTPPNGGVPPINTPPNNQPPTAPPTAPPYNAPESDQQITGSVVKVDATPPATVTLRVANRVRTYNLSPNALIVRQTAPNPPVGATPAYGRPQPLADVSRLLPGEEIRVSLNENGEATRLTSFVTLATARVRYAQDNQIVLEDARGTTLTIGPNLRYTDSRGRSASTANLQPGSSVALFIAPGSRLVYNVSAASSDVSSATDPSYVAPDDSGTNYPPNTAPPTNPGNTPPNTFPPGTNPGTPPDGAPIINLVQHNALRPLRNGGQFTVTLRGTAGARASFSVVPAAPEQPLQEDPNSPGLYTGQYTVRAGDNILNGRITAFLRNDAGQEAIQQSRTPITIDTVAPRITTTSPTDGATIASTEPNIVVYANDIGGSGLSRAKAYINGQEVPAEAITVSPTSVSIVPLEPLSGQVSVRVNVADAAQNSASTTFAFFADTAGGNNLITSVTHNATRALQPGDRVLVSITAPAGGRAAIDLLGGNNRIVAQNVPATEIAEGRYRATYTIQANTPEAQLYVRARFTDAAGRVSTSDAVAPVVLTGDTTGPVTVSGPVEGDRVATPLVVRGRANPNATVEVSVTAQGVRYFIFEYKNELGTQQIQADARGEWATAPLNLPKPTNVSSLTYVITATQTDAGGRRSDPVTVNVLPR